ncbi:MAG: hypothetical protein H6713_14355 [Myxococcales bacterium]|nr:hypothetical protein [Myxococcales bacterium]MCB9751156.1 hypothetical protein [Myxococcales bacterium]
MPLDLAATLITLALAQPSAGTAPAPTPDAAPAETQSPGVQPAYGSPQPAAQPYAQPQTQAPISQSPGATQSGDMSATSPAPDAPPAEATDARGGARAGAAPVIGPMPTKEYVTEVNRYARGPNLGVEFGMWGTGMINGLKTDIGWGKRLGQFLGTRVSFRYFTPLRFEGAFDPLLFASVELFGRSPVLMGVARLYGGGGVFFGGRPSPQSPGDAFGVTGGGHMGFEFFLNRKFSFTLELGGQGPMHVRSYDAGVSVVGGVVFYFVRT